jgi:hypothetical protein
VQTFSCAPGDRNGGHIVLATMDGSQSDVFEDTEEFKAKLHQIDNLQSTSVPMPGQIHHMIVVESAFVYGSFLWINNNPNF